MRKFQYNCVNPRSLSELEYIVDNYKNITYSTFIKNVDKEQLQDLKVDLGYTPGSLPTLKTDWAVRFGKVFLPKKQIWAYILIHSGIEYVFY